MDRAAPHRAAAWSFDAAALPPERRAEAWADAMRRLYLPFASPEKGKGEGRQEDGQEGSVIARTSPMGFDFALVSGGAQTIAGQTPEAERGLWLGLLIEGEAWLEADGETWPLDRGTLIYGATGVDAALGFRGAFRQLFVRIPSLAIDARMLTPLAARVSTIRPDGMAGNALLYLLCSVANSLDRGFSGDVSALDSALVELLVPVLAEAGGTAARGGATASRARQFDRVCRMLEAHLGDPDLGVKMLAQMEGVSVRYLQQLFSRSGQTVTGYIKARRLERARAELESPLHGQLSITEIGFRWGFSQSAHFSRAYRERFGEAPRESRRRANSERPQG